jgi:hypothetical protein
MFANWKIKREIGAISRRAEVSRQDLVRRNVSPERLLQFDHEMHEAIRDFLQRGDARQGLLLLITARELDVAVPPYMDETIWQHSDYGPAELTAEGRGVVRKLIDAEKSRRFDVKTLWVTKFWLPLLSALVGIIGALTGLMAVLQHKK